MADTLDKVIADMRERAEDTPLDALRHELTDFADRLAKLRQPIGEGWRRVGEIVMWNGRQAGEQLCKPHLVAQWDVTPTHPFTGEVPPAGTVLYAAAPKPNDPQGGRSE